MSLFKKPKRNFRSRKTQDNESGDENHESNMAEDGGDEGGTTSVFQAASNMRKSLNKKKKNRNTIGSDDTSNTTKSTLSFGEEINEADAFKVKKPSRSKHRAKQLKRESRREREEEEKREAIERATNPSVNNKNGSAGPEDMDVSDESNKDDRSRSVSESDSEEEKEEERKKRQAFDRILKAGAIPDAHMIHMARKRRQQAREHGDFIPLDEPEKADTSNSRLIREEDHDHSDDDDEPLSFSVNTREKELRKMQESIITAQEERSNSEDSDHEREWEEQQIRKGVSIPQVAPATSEAVGSNGSSYDQYLYGQSSNIFNQNAPDLMNTAQPAIPTRTQEQLANLPISLDLAKKSLQDRLETLTSVHRAHVKEQETITSRLESCESSITQCKNSQGGLEEQYKFFQEMRGYVRDLVECLNEKVPSINFLERSMNHHLKSRAEDLVTRRQDDLKDQSEDVKLAFQNRMPKIQIEPEKQRRVAEREARRARRRRAREARGIKNHHEGMSTDDEENKTNMSKFKLAKEQIEHDCDTMFNDVNEEFYRPDLIRERFEEWKYRYSETYEQAYIGLCLPKLFTPFVRLELVTWNPIEESNCVDFEEMTWYEALMFYGYREGEAPEPKDLDLKLIPSLIEKVLLPKLTDQVDRVWDPLSSNQTLHLGAITKRLIRDYPSVTAESKNTQELLKTIVRRLRKTLSDDVFIPLCSKQMMESKGSPSYLFAQRQFWTCIKLLSNLMVWQGMLSDRVVKELTLDSLLNRYLLLALQTTLNTSPVDDVIYKSQAVVACLPKAWFMELKGDKTLQQLTMLCRFLNTFADTIGKKAKHGSDSERREARETLKQITKMFVTLHGMDHAIALSEKFSLKM